MTASHANALRNCIILSLILLGEAIFPGLAPYALILMYIPNLIILAKPLFIQNRED